MALEEDTHNLEDTFAAAVKVIWNLPEEGCCLFFEQGMKVGLIGSAQLCATLSEVCACWCVNSLGD